MPSNELARLIGSGYFYAFVTGSELVAHFFDSGRRIIYKSRNYTRVGIPMRILHIGVKALFFAYFYTALYLLV